MRSVRATIAAVENAIIIIIIITYSACVFLALGIQHAKRMRRIILSSMVSTILFHAIS